MSVAKATLGGMAFAASIIAFIGVVAIAFVGPMFVFASVFESVLAVIVGVIIGTILACGCITGVSALLAPQ